MPATNKKKRACARITATGQKSNAATFRNIQPPITFRGILASCATFRNIPTHNAIVIMQTTQTAFHKQQKCDSANNASVIMTNRSSHNAIVISRSHWQAFATFRNISSAYLSYRLGLCSTFAPCDTSGLAQAHVYYSTPVLPCGYAHIIISLYDHMPIAAYNGSVMKRYKQAKNQPCPKQAKNQPCPIFQNKPFSIRVQICYTTLPGSCHED